MDMYRFSLILMVTVLAITVLAGHKEALWSASAPVVTAITAAATSGGSETSLSLTENTTTTLYVHGVIIDADGCADVATNGTVSGVFYRSNHASGDACSTDNNDCYTVQNANCSKTACDGPEDTTFSYECTAQIQYYADSTTTGTHSGADWTAKITATDAAVTSGSNTDTIEMASTAGLDATTSIEYGTVDLNAQSSEQTLSITNTGNSGVDADLSVDADMTCTDGTVPAGNAHYAANSGFSYATGTALTTTPTQHELNLAPRTDDAMPATGNIYFLLTMPESNVSGSCSNTLTVTATADTENGW